MGRYVPCLKCGKGPTERAGQILAECKRRDPGGRSLGIFNCRNKTDGKGLSLHACGRAVDWAPTNRGAGAVLAAWLAGPAGPSDIQQVIWDGWIWDVRVKTWRRLSPKSNQHTDHLHIETNRAKGD